MQTFPTSVHSVSNFATQKAELHIFLHSRAWRGCAGSALLRAAMLAALAAGQLQTTWSGSQAPPSVIGMKQEPIEPEKNPSEGVWASLWMYQGHVEREERKEKKRTTSKDTNKTSTKPKQNTFFGLSLTTLWDLACMFLLAREHRKDEEIYLQRTRRQVQNKNTQH